MFRNIIATAAVALLIFTGGAAMPAHAAVDAGITVTAADPGRVADCVCESCGGPIDPEGHCKCS